MSIAPLSTTQYPPNCYFAVVCEASHVPGYETMTGQIYFAPVTGRQIPEEMRQLKDEVEDMVTGLSILFPDQNQQRRNAYFAELLALAQMGLACDQARPSAGLDAIRALKRRIVKLEGGSTKRKQLNKLGAFVLMFAILFVGGGAMVHHIVDPKLVLDVHLSNYCYMLAAAMPAMWLSFASRKLRLTFEDLYQPDDDLMGPFHRVFYVIGFTLVLALFGYMKFVGVFFGKFSTETLGTSLTSAVVFGFACGFSENLLATTVIPHIGRIMSGLSEVAKGKASQS